MLCRRLVGNKRKVTKMFWGVTVLISFVGLSLHLFHIIRSYLQYEFTESTFERRGKLRFPDVSICNMRGISSSNFEAAAKTSDRVNAIFQDVTQSQSSNNDLHSLHDYMAFAEEDAKLMGHRFEDMLLNCVFSKQPCKKNDFEHFLFPTFINCFTFVRGRHSLLTTKGGLDTALSVVVYLEPENSSYMGIYSHKTTFAFSSGVRVLLTPPNHLRAIGYSAYEAAPGTSTSLVFETTEHTRLPEPYNQCRHATGNMSRSDAPYSFAECRNECIHAKVTKQCGCTPTLFLVRFRSNVSSCAQYLLVNETLSDNLVRCQTDAVESAMQTPNYFSDKCQCFWPCSHTKYSVTVSQSAWPARHSLKYFLQNTLENNSRQRKLKAFKYYQKLKSSNASEDQIYSWVTNHFVKLNIYSRNDLVLVKEETPKYTITNLLSSIGGCLGLWVGISVLTFSKFCDKVIGMTGIGEEKKKNRPLPSGTCASQT